MKVAFSRATRYLGGNSSDDRERLIPRSTPIGAQVQNQKAASVYIFGDADVTQDEVNTDCDASEMHELRPRGKTAKPRKKYCENRTEQEIEYFERAVGKDDTLQSIALKYGCQVARLKRANNLIQDQDFYALKTIKVPVKRFGLITELIAEEESRTESRQNGPNTSSASVFHTEAANDGSDEEEELLVRTLSIPRVGGSQSRAAHSFLARMDADIIRIVSSTNSRKESLDEVTSTLTRRQIRPLSKSPMMGADCGVNWCSMIALVFCVALLVPCVMFLYFEYFQDTGGDEVTLSEHMSHMGS